MLKKHICSLCNITRKQSYAARLHRPFLHQYNMDDVTNLATTYEDSGNAGDRSSLSESEKLTEKKDFQQIASYNCYVEKSDTDILTIIPGVPKVFDENGAMGALSPCADFAFAPMRTKYPLEGVVQATKICTLNERRSADFRFSNVDFLGNWFFIDNLLSYLGAAPARSFRINVSRIGRTVLFSPPDRPITGTGISKYRDDFLHKSCRSVLSPPIDMTYHQVVQYQFGQYQMLLGFIVQSVEADENISDFVKINRTSPLNLFPLKYPDSTVRIVQWGKRSNYKLLEFCTQQSSHRRPVYVGTKMFFTGVENLILGIIENDECVEIQRYSLDEVYRFPWSQNDKSLIPTREAVARLYQCLEYVVNFMRNQKEERTFAIVWKPTFGRTLPMYAIRPELETLLLPSDLASYVKSH